MEEEEAAAAGSDKQRRGERLKIFWWKKIVESAWCVTVKRFVDGGIGAAANQMNGCHARERVFCFARAVLLLLSCFALDRGRAKNVCVWNYDPKTQIVLLSYTYYRIIIIIIIIHHHGRRRGGGLVGLVVEEHLHCIAMQYYIYFAFVRL